MTRRRRQFNHDLPRLRRAVEQRAGEVQGNAAAVHALLAGFAETVAEGLADLEGAMGAIETDLAAWRRIDPSAPPSLDAVLGPPTVTQLKRIMAFTDAAFKLRPALALVPANDTSPTTTTGRA